MYLFLWRTLRLHLHSVQGAVMVPFLCGSAGFQPRPRALKSQALQRSPLLVRVPAAVWACSIAVGQGMLKGGLKSLDSEDKLFINTVV